MENPYNIHRRKFLKQSTMISLGGMFMPWCALKHGLPYGNVSSSTGKFVPVMLTPYNSDLSVDFEGLSRLTDFYLESGAEGLFANCLSSEMYNLTESERLDITQHVVNRVASKAPVVATGSFGKTIEEKASFSKKIYDVGVEAVILVSNHFVNREESDDVLMRNLEHFLSITKPVQLGTYECPSPYKRIITPEVYSFLLETGRFFYHKDTTENIDAIVAKLRLSKGSPLKLYNAHIATAVESLRAGAAGMSPISGNFYPEIIHWICKNANDLSKQNDADWIQREISQTEKIISAGYPNSAKYFLRKRGLNIQEGSRTRKDHLSVEQAKGLDQVYDRFVAWCDRLNITVKDRLKM